MAAIAGKDRKKEVTYNMLGNIGDILQLYLY